MYDKLSEVDIRKMQEEIDYRMKVVRPKCVEDLATAAAFGDRSENYEYKAAKQELRRCDSRLRYLRRMIDTARIVKGDDRQDVAGLFDQVDVYFEEEDVTETYTLMTTLRMDAGKNIISPESPLGKALVGHRVGDRAQVKVNDRVSYWVQLRGLRKGADDDSLPIRPY